MSAWGMNFYGIYYAKPFFVLYYGPVYDLDGEPGDGGIQKEPDPRMTLIQR